MFKILDPSQAQQTNKQTKSDAQDSVVKHHKLAAVETGQFACPASLRTGLRHTTLPTVYGLLSLLCKSVTLNPSNSNLKQK